MPKVNREKASDATINPPHPGDPTSDVTRDGGEPLHKPPQPGAWMDEHSEWHAAEDHANYVDDDGNPVKVDDDKIVKAAAVPSSTGRDAAADGSGGPAVSPYTSDSDPAQAWRDDPMPEDGRERLDWAQRGTDTDARINAALRAEEARGGRKRATVVTGLEKLRAEHKRNEFENR